MSKRSKTPEPLYRQFTPEEDRGKTMVSKYYRVNQNMDGKLLGVGLHPYNVECNIRIDFGQDGGIYKDVGSLYWQMNNAVRAFISCHQTVRQAVVRMVADVMTTPEEEEFVHDLQLTIARTKKLHLIDSRHRRANHSWMKV